MSESGKVLGVERKKFISILLIIGICYMFLLFFLNRALFHLAKNLDGKYHAFLGNTKHPTFTILAIIVYTATVFAIWYIAKASKKRQSLMVLFLINAIIGFFALLFLIIISIIGTGKSIHFSTN
ncbi:hypothetical protein WR25_04807 isoform A [Diploscapter pachys]|uniref:Uncharacterized protein n=1 Tax=Diploscapter pachys TaxID=2018661 RepID=A0A2A2LNM6_9BILA|nr:hypothetical protein WR25_04807 isoform A [Diploscapter pachys]